MRESHEEIVVKDDALAAKFHVLARNSAGRVEAIVHNEHPLFGVQFHPEKSGEFGVKLLVNFLKMIP
jgi:imidazoleglycerol phosphate synthase glutamine amidotransferase subunit HisH